MLKTYFELNILGCTAHNWTSIGIFKLWHSFSKIDVWLTWNEKLIIALWVDAVESHRNLTVFCFQGVEKWCIGNYWVNSVSLKYVLENKTAFCLIPICSGAIGCKRWRSFCYNLSLVQKDWVSFGLKKRL